MTTLFPPPDATLLARHAAAERMPRRAGALRYFEACVDLANGHKAAQDRVSEAGRAVETLIRAEVAAEFPEDAFLGEEQGETAGVSPYLWVVDLIDGATPFLSGLADGCVSIAVVVADEPVVGIVHAPRHRETFAAVRGFEGTVNGRPLGLDPSRSLSDGMFAFGGSLRCDAAATGGFITRLMRAGGIAFHNSWGALMLAYVADGRLVGYYDEVIMPWDCMAGLALVEAAGGLTRFAGRRDGGPMLAGAPRVFDAVAPWLD